MVEWLTWLTHFRLTPTDKEFLPVAASFVSGVLGARLGSRATTRAAQRTADATITSAGLTYESAEAQRRQQLQLAREERWAPRQVALYLQLLDVSHELDDFRLGGCPGRHKSEGEFRAWRAGDPLTRDEARFQALAREIYAFASEEVRQAHEDVVSLHDEAISWLAIVVEHERYQSTPADAWVEHEREWWKKAWRYKADAGEATYRLRRQIRGELAGWGEAEPLKWPWQAPMPGMEPDPEPPPPPLSWAERLAAWWG